MRPDTNAPPDTRTVGIVHGTLRRALERARIAPSGRPKPPPSQHRAIADHVLWMMHCLHNHHTGEDDGLWPLTRSKRPEAGALLDQREEAEYDAIEQRYFVKPKGLLELAAEGHWIPDGLDPASRDVVVDLVPAVPRSVLIRGFARRYRRRAQLLLGDGPATRITSLPVDATQRAQ